MRSRGIVALVLALSLVACRQLTGPVREDATPPKYILARGQVLGVGGVPITNTRVRIAPESSNDNVFTSLDIDTDERGFFEIQLPNVPLEVTIYPASTYALPDLRFDYVHFQDGVRQTFAYTGRFYSGIVELAQLGLNYGSGRVHLSTRVPVGEGSYQSVTNREYWGEGGRFRIYAPRDGYYHAKVDACCPQLTYEWPDSVELVPDDSLHLVLPAVSHQLTLTLGGSPLPAGEVLVSMRSWSDSDTRLDTYLDCDGQQQVFDLVDLPGLTRCGLSVRSNPEPPIFGTPGLLNFVPQTYLIPPLEEGSALSFELGEYELEIQMLDPEGAPVGLSDVSLESEIGMYSSLRLTSDREGKVVFRVNPAGYYLAANPPDPYESIRRYFVLEGDTQMVFHLQPVSQKETVR